MYEAEAEPARWWDWRGWRGWRDDSLVAGGGASGLEGAAAEADGDGVVRGGVHGGPRYMGDVARGSIEVRGEAVPPNPWRWSTLCNRVRWRAEWVASQCSPRSFVAAAVALGRTSRRALAGANCDIAGCELT